MKLFLTLIFSVSTVLGISQSDNYCKSIKEHRQHYKSEFLSDQRAPLKQEDLSNLRFYKAKKKYKIQCSATLTPESIPFEMPTYSGITKPFKKYADLQFELGGQAYTLCAYQNLNLLKMPMYKNHLFIPFKDKTNDVDTYGGGRYIDMETHDIEKGVLTLDFNKAYNPWCAYSDGYNCPIPPLENHLSIELKAGEKKYVGQKKKAH
jgi:uncharacterized protein (DUF1684 family)